MIGSRLFLSDAHGGVALNVKFCTSPADTLLREETDVRPRTAASSIGMLSDCLEYKFLKMERKMEKKIVDQIVDRFLAWPLPKDFSPDGRISFNPAPDAMGNEPTWPVGTNLLTAVQAKEMVEHILGETLRQRESLLVACQAAYAKHHMDCDLIGWDELSIILHEALCNSMGSEEYGKWVDSAKQTD